MYFFTLHILNIVGLFPTIVSSKETTIPFEI